MFAHENGLLISGSYFFLTLLVLPGLIGWWYDNHHPTDEAKSTPRVMPLSEGFKTPPHAA